MRWLLIVFSLLALAAPSLGYADSAMKNSIPSSLAEHSLLVDVTATQGVIAAVGERGHILISHDEGRNWRQAKVPTQALLTGIFFLNKRLGWAVGHDAIILRTGDGGEQWELVFSAPEEEAPLLDVWFKNANHGLAVGAYGLLFETTDGGSNWAQRVVSSEDDFHLNRIEAAANGVLYIAAENGIVYRSGDDGQTWQALISPYEGSFFTVLPLTNNRLLVAGLRGHLFRFDDGAQNWNAIATATDAMLTSAVKLNNGVIVVAGFAGTLLTSADAGNTFAYKQLRSRHAIANIVQADDDTLILVGEAGIQRLAIEELPRATSQ